MTVRGGAMRMGASGALAALLALAPRAAAADGDFAWAWRVGSTAQDGILDVAAAGDAVHAVGEFTGTVDFDPGPGEDLRTSAGGRDAFAMKIDAAGTPLWVRTFGGAADDSATEAAVDGAGNVVVAGSFQSAPGDFDPGPGAVPLGAAGGADVFVVKLDADGALLWAGAMGGADTDLAADAALDAAGHLFLAAVYFGGAPDFDPGPGAAVLTHGGGIDAAIVKLDAAGALLWVRSIAGASNEKADAIAVDAAGNPAVAGAFDGTADLDPGPGTIGAASAGLLDAFVLKLDGAGNTLWAKTAGGPGSDQARAVTVDAAGDVVFAGSFAGTADFDPGPAAASAAALGLEDAFVAKWTAAGGFAWVRTAGGADQDVATAVCTSAAGEVYAAGTFRSTAYFDGAPHTAAGASDLFVWRCSATGAPQWLRTAGGAAIELANAIALDGAQRARLGGAFFGAADFDPGPASYLLSPAGAGDAWLLALDGPGLDAPDAVAIVPETVGPTNAAAVAFTVSFDEAVTGFDMAADLVILHSGSSNTGAVIAGGPSVYTVTVTGLGGNGAFTLAVGAAGGVQDLGGLPLASSVTSAPVTVDHSPPQVIIGAAAPDQVNRHAAVQFPIAVAGAGAVQIGPADVTAVYTGSAGGGTVQVFGGTTATPTVAVSGIEGDGRCAIAIAAGVAIDAAGNASAATGESAAYATVDNTLPAVTVAAPIGSPASRTGTIDFPVQVEGAAIVQLAPDDIVINHSGTWGGALTVIGGAASTPTVRLEGLEGNGTLTILIAAGIAMDAAGNASLPAGPHTSAIVDNAAPVFSNLSAAPARAAGGDRVAIAFDASEWTAGDPDVTVNGRPAERTAKSAPHYAYAYTVHPLDPPGPAAIAIGGVDAAGNAGYLETGGLLTLLEHPLPLISWPAALALILAAARLARRR